MKEAFDLVVAGAGVMGLGCAWEEARRGQKVAVFDPSLGGAASMAAAGILVTRDARVFMSPFREFYVRSIRMYPEWLDVLSKASGTEVALHRSGDFLVFDAAEPAGRERFESKLRQLERERAREFTVTERLPDILESFSPIRKPITLHFPGEGYVQNRDLIASLRAACERAGVVFRQGMPSKLPDSRNGNTVFEFPEGEWRAARFLIAAGAWSGRILEQAGLTAPMVPVKGQMIRIPKFHSGDSLIHFGDELYLVPRGDSLVVGATTEPGVWDDGFDEIGEKFLEARLRRLLPHVEHGPIERWAGIRPRTRDRLPWMGWVDQERGWAICAGHYKCGISMAPLAALCLSRLLHGEKPLLDLTPFNPLRSRGLQKNNS